jgi:hypothetical protein
MWVLTSRLSDATRFLYRKRSLSLDDNFRPLLLFVSTEIGKDSPIFDLKSHRFPSWLKGYRIALPKLPEARPDHYGKC